MPTDHRASSRRPSGNRHPLLLGIVLGLLLGVGLSVGVAIWLKGFANPFVAQPKPVEPLPKPASRAPGAETRPDDKAKSDRPRFEFYDVLPSDKGAAGREQPAAPREAQPAKEATPKEAPPKEAPAREMPVREAAKDSAPEAPREDKKPPPEAAPPTLWLQAGAFADPKDAENMRVQIALSGLEASVKVAEVPGRGRLHRVRVGPFASMGEANRVKASLSQNGISTTLVRAEDSR